MGVYRAVDIKRAQAAQPHLWAREVPAQHLRPAREHPVRWTQGRRQTPTHQRVIPTQEPASPMELQRLNQMPIRDRLMGSGRASWQPQARTPQEQQDRRGHRRPQLHRGPHPRAESAGPQPPINGTPTPRSTKRTLTSIEQWKRSARIAEGGTRRYRPLAAGK